MAKQYPPKVKFQVVVEVSSGEKTSGQVAKAYGVHPNSVSAWKRAFLEKEPEVFAQDGTITQYERRIAELERQTGKKEVEIALLETSWGRRYDHRAGSRPGEPEPQRVDEIAARLRPGDWPPM